MGLNPFKESNLDDLQHIIKSFISKNTDYLIETLKSKWAELNKKAKERLTIMLIPHSEKRIINFHVPIYSIVTIIAVILLTVIITSIAIINHTSTIKDVSKLKRYDTNSKAQIEQYKKEIDKLYKTFNDLKPEIKKFYALSNRKESDSLWAKGGPNLQGLSDYNVDSSAPTLEELNLKEIEEELEVTKNVFKKINDFVNARKKILESTPSIWPANGYIISKYNSASSLLMSEAEHSKGIAIASFPGTAIRATAQGEVEKISWHPELGLQIIIRHKYAFYTVYSHCERVVVQEPEPGESVEVEKGEIIGYVGKTGKADRPMCFYQVKIGTDFIDPLPLLNKITQ